MIKLLIAGSRDILDYNLIEDNIKNPENIKCIISGCARGVDTLAIEYAKKHNILCVKCPANWDLYGKSAGYRRNKYMVSICTHALIIWDGKSKGTKHTIDLCKENNIPYKLIQRKEIKKYA